MTRQYDYDYGTGFDRLAGPIEQRFGATPRFGIAGGCVNMVFDLESGHRVNITDAGSSHLTHIDRRTPADGFSVGIYTVDDYDNGWEPVVMLHRHIPTDKLLDLIADAINELSYL